MRVCVVCVKVCVLFVVYGGNVWYAVCAVLCLCVLFLFVCVVRVCCIWLCVFVCVRVCVMCLYVLIEMYGVMLCGVFSYLGGVVVCVLFMCM